MILKIFSKEKASVEKGTYCGHRWGEVYASDARLELLDKDGGIDSHELTNPELVVSDLANPELDFYKPWDLDGDGKKQEFIVRTYASCNGDRFSFLKVNKDENRIENIEVIHEDGSRGKYLFVDFNKDSFKVEDGIIKIKYYDNTQGEFFESWYKYDEKEQVLKLVEG